MLKGSDLSRNTFSRCSSREIKSCRGDHESKGSSKMAMGRKERLEMQKVLRERFIESNKPTKANTAVFYDQEGNSL